MNGFLLVNKSKNFTSYDVIRKIKKLGIKDKIGHAGSLDPLATGLLVVAIGKYTKKLNIFLKSNKEYNAIVKLGYNTKSWDSEFDEEFISDIKPDSKAVSKVIKEFNGKIELPIPAFSAKKKDGVSLYKLARKGVYIEDKTERYDMDVHIIDYKYPYLNIRCDVSKGTYIRSLAFSIGKKLNTGAYLYNLQRISVGDFELSDDRCVNLENLDSLETIENNLIYE